MMRIATVLLSAALLAPLVTASAVPERFRINPGPLAHPWPYARAVRWSAARHLADQSGVTVSESAITASGYRRGKPDKPCSATAPLPPQSAKGRDPTRAYEVLIATQGDTYRYIAFGYNGYYCGSQ